MSESLQSAGAAIVLRDVSKIYRLYQKPAYRVLDLFGLCPSGPGYYSEHSALKGVTLSIGRGEKVAIIGRNGAGKSTLLKIITQTVVPTGGTIETQGRVSALLQIGTGFHTDFSGRQNVYSGLAHLGITGKEADRKFGDIVEFSELEEYIDQPMKTYSTGMGARLMFAAATAIQPDILVIDELLGVGDAYFAHKSYERMRQMCSGKGTTLLLVTHDVYSALNLCERFIWIDRGEIKMEGDGKATINAYEASIKDQEEQRLRRRNQAAFEQKNEGIAGLRVQISSRSGFALPEPLAMARLSIRYQDGAELTLPVAEGTPAWTLSPEGNVGPITTVAGRECRCLSVYGSIYHKAEWTVAVPRSEGLKDFSFEWLYEGADAVDVQVFADDGRPLLREEIKGAKGWQQSVFQFGKVAGPEMAQAAKGHYGTGLIRITLVEFLNAAGENVIRIKHGERLTVRLKFAVKGHLETREPTFAIGFHKAGVAIGGYAYTDRLKLPEGEEFVLDATLAPLLLGSGQWLVTLGFAEADIYKQAYNPYFTVNDRWYHIIVRGFDMTVESSCSIDSYAFLVHPVVLALRGDGNQLTSDLRPACAAATPG